MFRQPIPSSGLSGLVKMKTDVPHVHGGVQGGTTAWMVTFSIFA
jgi:hypothetical protein